MKRRYKLLIGFIITGIILTIIFFITEDKKIYYLSLGDSLAVGQMENKTLGNSYGDYVAKYLKNKNKLEFYTKEFANTNYSSIDLLNDINNNRKIKVNNKNISIKNALIKADIVTISIGLNDLFYKLNIGTEFSINKYNSIYEYIDDSFVDINKLLYLIRKSCKEQIMVIGYYNPFTNYDDQLATSVEPIIEYANTKLKNLAFDYDMVYIDAHKLFLEKSNYLPYTFEVHPTEDGYNAISTAIISNINKKMLAK